MAENPNNPGSDWHLRLFQKSILKQAKLRQIVNLLGPTDGETCLDIGGDNGVISYQLRRRGGTWHSVDASEKAVESIRNLVGNNVQLMQGVKLPFADAFFDAVVIIDMLEHVQADYDFIEECHRVLKPGGRLVVNVPHVKSWSLLLPVRQMLGLTPEKHGHVRPGYTSPQLYQLLKDGFDMQESRTYSRFFVESLDTVIQFIASRKTRGETSAAKGVLIDAQDFQKMEKLFRAYSILYPFFWLASKLDLFLFFTQGHSLIVRAKWRQWRPRRTPVLADGRSIAEAALGGKIGTAAPF